MLRIHPLLADRFRREWWWTALASVALGLLLAAYLWQEYRATLARETQYLAQQAQLLHDNLSRQLVAINRVLSVVAQDAPEAIRGTDRQQEAFHQRLVAFSNALGAARSLNVVNAQGRVLDSDIADFLGADLSARAYIQKALSQSPSHDLILSEPFIGTLGGPVVALARRIREIDGRLGGLVVATLDKKELTHTLSAVRYTPDIFVGLAHGKGRRFIFLGENFPEPTTEVVAAQTPLGQHLQSGQTASVRQGPLERGGSDYLVALRTVAPQGMDMDNALVVSVGRTKASLLAHWRMTALWLIAAYLLGVLAACAGLRRMQRHWQRLQGQEAQREQRWQAVLNATQQGVWDYEVSTGAVYYSPGWWSMLGLAVQTQHASIDLWLARLHPDDAPQMQQALRQHLHGEKPLYESTHRIRHAQGHYLWMHDRGRIIERGAQGQPLRIVGAQMDISAQRAQQELLTRLAENVPGMIYQYQRRPDGLSSFPYSSAAIADIYGLSPEDVRADATPVYARLHHGDVAQVMASIAQSAQRLTVWQDEYRVVLPLRGERWISGQARPQRLDDGSILWSGYLHDITDTKAQALQLQETERVLQQIMKDMPVGLCMVDGAHRIYFRNRRFIEYFGYTDSDIATLHDWALKAYPEPDYREQIARQWKAAKADGLDNAGRITTQTYRIAAKDGTQRIMDVGGLVFGDHLLVTFQDRTELEAQNELLHKLAYIDGLTGIANRRQFDQVLAAEWRRCRRSHKPLSIIMLDIDYFKPYNDLYGHAQGDTCLHTVAQTLRAHFTRSHDLVARYGGEEFVCLLPECDVQGAAHKAEALRAAVQALGLAHKGSAVAPVVTLSLGLACTVPDAEHSPDQLLYQADAQLYRAKAGGRNRVAYEAA